MLTSEEAKIILEKLRKHYKLQYTYDFHRRSGGLYRGGLRHISLPTHIPLSLLCHEVAHALDHQRYAWHGMERKHNKKFDRLVKRVTHYCERHNSWRAEVERRTAIPEPKPEPTKEQQRLNKIEHKKTLLQSYEKKLRYWTKLYNNKIRRCKKSIAALNRHSTSQCSHHSNHPTEQTSPPDAQELPAQEQ